MVVKVIFFALYLFFLDILSSCCFVQFTPNVVWSFYCSGVCNIYIYIRVVLKFESRVRMTLKLVG